jgi:hypothetical protein
MRITTACNQLNLDLITSTSVMGVANSALDKQESSYTGFIYAPKEFPQQSFSPVTAKGISEQPLMIIGF